ncbi:recombinase family protein [Streptomyces mirabilis]|uniref:recombinase family protein n=1 Tax=Streptomyces mirabilis TaxID=68239 RepID=UPI00225046BD|nr:recombinase family protein [Streptomyces mirabilis]MCX5349177.1 recombinase family protein [Streptomyces mirabilis]
MAANTQVSAAREPLCPSSGMHTPQLRGVSALRLSVLTDETTSPERQREANRGAAASLGIDLADREAVDLGVSASKTTPFERPELGAWLQRPDDFDALIFWRFDRAVRSMDDMHELAKWARENRKMIVLAEGPGGRLVLDFRNPLDPMAQLMVTLFAFAAQMEAQAIRERVTSAQAAMRVMPLRWRGSRPPYGYMPAELEGGGWTLTQDPEAVAVIERIIRELLGDLSNGVTGKSAAAIAKGLNEDGIPSPRDHWSLRQGRKTGGKTGGKAGETVTRERFAWRHSSIKELLTSERLLGWKTENNKPVRDSAGNPVMATAEPILRREEFDAIGAVLDGLSVDNKKPDRVDTVALLLRVILCEGCGERMYLHRPSPNSKSTSKTETYKCGSHTRGRKCASPAIIKREWADEYAEREFLRMLGALEITHTRTVPGYDPQPEIDATLAEYEEHQAQQGRQKSSAAKAAWQRRADALDARLAELEDRPKVEPRREEIRTGKRYTDVWRGADVTAKREMLVEAGAILTVKRGTRGGWRKLDESRVIFDVRDPFFADAASELTAMATIV